jgi:hypothetical protein
MKVGERAEPNAVDQIESGVHRHDQSPITERKAQIIDIEDPKRMA